VWPVPWDISIGKEVRGLFQNRNSTEKLARQKMKRGQSASIAMPAKKAAKKSGLEPIVGNDR